MMKYIFLLIVPMVLIGTLIVSCSDDDENGGEPTIYYIRNTDPTKSDSLYSGASLGGLIAIVGENLGNTEKIFFNDQEAVLITTYITNTSILVNVPSDAPKEKTDKMTLFFKNGKKLEYNFEVVISAPVLNSMDNEWAKEGETASINGNYFFEPVTIKLADGSSVTPSAVSQMKLDFVVPANAPEGPITVTTNFGTTKSTFFFHDTRNIILNYDNLTTTGAWRVGTFVTDDHSIDGNYVKFKGTYNAGDGQNEGASPNSLYESQFWAATSGRPAGNFLPAGDPSNYALKFECKVIDWHGSYLNICFAPYGFELPTGGSNQEVWSNSFNARAIWGPWDVKNAAYNTNGKWMTVTIPITEFKWGMGKPGADVVYTPLAFDKTKTGSLSFWVLPAPQAANSPFEFFIDNVRLVSIK